jgi:hypothetical protein
MNRRELLRISASVLSAATVPAHLAAHANTAPLILRRIPSSGEELPVIGLGTSGPFEAGHSPPGRRISMRRAGGSWL